MRVENTLDATCMTRLLRCRNSFAVPGVWTDRVAWVRNRCYCTRIFFFALLCLITCFHWFVFVCESQFSTMHTCMSISVCHSVNHHQLVFLSSVCFTLSIRHLVSQPIKVLVNQSVFTSKSKRHPIAFLPFGLRTYGSMYVCPKLVTLWTQLTMVDWWWIEKISTHKHKMCTDICVRISILLSTSPPPPSWCADLAARYTTEGRELRILCRQETI